MHPPATVKDHEELRRSTELRVTLVQAPDEANAAAGPVFTPSPNSQLNKFSAFSISLFFSGRPLDASLLEAAVAGLAGELPHLAGRGRMLGGGRIEHQVVFACNAGVELAVASAPGISLESVGPHTWASISAARPPGVFPLPFYAQPLSVTAAAAGEEPPLRLRLTDLEDGQVLSLGVWHVLADVRGAMLLLERLAAHYRGAKAGGRPVEGQPLTADCGLFGSPEELLGRLVERPADWTPRAEEGLSLRQWLAAPGQLLRTLRTPVDVHLLYLPAPVAARVKAAAQARVPGTCLSTNDAVQGLLHTLVAHARRLPLVAGPGAHNAMMIDMLNGTLRLREPSAAGRYLGNGVYIVKLPGGDEPLPEGLLEALQEGAAGTRFEAAAAANAARVRRGVMGYRADARPTLDSVAQYARMTRSHPLALGLRQAAADGRTHSYTSSVTKFPPAAVDFGGAGLRYLQIENTTLGAGVGYCILTPALGIDDGAGILVHMVLASGMGRRLREHEAWEGLLHGAQLVLAGETAAPLGSGAAAEEAPQAPQAGRGCIIS